MAALASVEDVQAALRRSLTGDEEVVASLLLDQASAIVQAEARQTIVAVTDDVVNLTGNWGWALDLPERPVVAVGHVAIDGVTLAAAAWSWRGGNTILGGRTPLGGGYPLIVNGPDLGDDTSPILGSWGGPDRRITVTYSHGYATDNEEGFPPLPAELRTICAQLVARAMQNPGAGVRSTTLGDASISYADAPNGALALTPWEQGVLRKYRP